MDHSQSIFSNHVGSQYVHNWQSKYSKYYDLSYEYHSSTQFFSNHQYQQFL